MSISIVRELQEEEWRYFVELHPGGNIFHTPEMFQVFSAAKNHCPELWAAISDGHPLALMLPVKVSVTNGPLRSLTTRAIVYGDVICEPSREGQEALKILMSRYLRETKGALLFTEFRHKASNDEVRTVLEECGAVFEGEDNYLIDLALPLDQVWQNISKSTRKHIRHAQRQANFIIEEVHSRKNIRLWHSIVKETFSRVHVPLADRSLFEAAYDILYPKGMVKFMLGRVDDQYIAGSVALLYKKEIYGWYRGFNREYKEYLPNDLMVWDCLQSGTEKGYQIFDFGGAGMSDQEYGPRGFKAKFGGKLVHYGRHKYVHSSMRLQVTRCSYELIRRVLWRNRARRYIIHRRSSYHNS